MAFEGADLIKAAAFLGAGLAMGLGAIGPGVGEGMVAAKACEAIGKNPKEAGLLTRTMLVGQAVSESTGIYSLVIALLLLFSNQHQAPDVRLFHSVLSVTSGIVGPSAYRSTLRFSAIQTRPPIFTVL